MLVLIRAAVIADAGILGLGPVQAHRTSPARPRVGLVLSPKDLLGEGIFLSVVMAASCLQAVPTKLPSIRVMGKSKISTSHLGVGVGILASGEAQVAPDEVDICELVTLQKAC